MTKVENAALDGEIVDLKQQVAYWQQRFEDINTVVKRAGQDANAERALRLAAEEMMIAERKLRFINEASVFEEQDRIKRWREVLHVHGVPYADAYLGDAIEQLCYEAGYVKDWKGRVGFAKDDPPAFREVLTNTLAILKKVADEKAVLAKENLALRKAKERADESMKGIFAEYEATMLLFDEYDHWKESSDLPALVEEACIAAGWVKVPPGDKRV